MAVSSELTAADVSTKHLETLLRERFSNIVIEGVYASDTLPGFYEVVTPEEIAYVDAGGTRLIMGNVMDIASRDNLTAKRWHELNKIDFKSLPFDKAIRIVKGDGSRTLAIFEDPFCPFCAELEKNLQHLDDVTMYVFLYPLEELHPGASDAAREIWCADNRADAWTAWMLDEKAPPKTACARDPVDELAELGKRLKIYSTPTLFFADGLRATGVVDTEKLEKKLRSTLATQGK